MSPRISEALFWLSLTGIVYGPSTFAEKRKLSARSATERLKSVETVRLRLRNPD